MSTEVKREKINRHTPGYSTRPGLYGLNRSDTGASLNSPEGRDSETGLTTSFNSSDVDQPAKAETGDSMLVYVLNKNSQPLMPCTSAKARIILKQGKAEVIARKPFTIRLIYGSSGYRQSVTLGVDSGFTHIGVSAVAEKKELYSSEVKLRTDIVKLNSERRQYRRSRRNRKTWYRKARFLNRKKPEGWLAPSIQHKLDSHIKLIERVGKILPITRTVIKVAAFDIQKIKNPGISGTGYQNGDQKGFWNVREYVLYRDNHTCQNCKGKSKDPVLEVHHIISRQTGGDSPDNLITLCKTCHDKVSLGKIKLKVKPSKQFKAETFMTMVRWRLVNELRKDGHDIYHTYGYITKGNRIELGLSKSHTNDAFVIAGGNNQARSIPYRIIQNRRNNRSLQINRKGYKPSIRKQRYPLQPGDLVKSGNMLCTVKGVFSYGKQIRLKDISGVTINTRFENVSLVKYGKGFRYAA